MADPAAYATGVQHVFVNGELVLDHGRPNGRLIDGGTFSSASLFAILVRDNDLGMLIGEPIGNPPSFKASEIHLDIPHLPYFLNLSTARLIRPDINAGPAETILPDVLAPLTADALATGTDPALDFVRTR